jgi:hypothetical protein
MHSDDIETGVVSQPREEHGGNLPTGHCGARCIGGATLIWALVRELENLLAMAREKAQVAEPRGRKYRCAKAGADCFVVCAEQRIVQEGLSPSDARMRSVVSESGGNASLAGESWQVWRSLNGHESESWIQPRRTWSHHSQYFRRAGCPS